MRFTFIVGLMAVGLLPSVPVHANPESDRCGPALREVLARIAQRSAEKRSSSSGPLLHDDQRVISILQSRETMVVNRDFAIAGQRFRGTSILSIGERSSSRVYKGQDSRSRPVLIKVLNPDVGKWFAEYDVLATRYLRERGVDVPAVIAADLKEGRVVREYVEGLTFEELHEVYLRRPADKAEYLRHRQALRAELRRIRTLFAGFEEWLRHQKPPPSADFMKQSGMLRKYGDVKVDNLLFDIRRKKWVVNDP